MKSFSIQTLLLTPLLYFSCSFQQSRMIEIENTTRQLVVNGIIQSPDTLGIFVTRSNPVGTIWSDEENLLQESPTIHLYENEVLVDSLDLADHVPNIYLEYFSQAEHDNRSFYSSKTFKTEVGNRYRVDISSEIGLASATAVQLVTVPIDSIYIYKEPHLTENNSFTRIKLTVDDPENESNYYQIRLTEYYPSSDKNNIMEPFSINPISYSNPSNKINVNQDQYILYDYLIFSDVEIDSSNQYDLLTLWSYDEPKPEEMELRMELRHISKETYDYLTDVINQTEAKRDPYAEPYFIKGNIVGGLGIFSLPGYSYKSIPELSNQIDPTN